MSEVDYSKMPYLRWAVPKRKEKYFDAICDELKYRCPEMDEIKRGDVAEAMLQAGIVIRRDESLNINLFEDEHDYDIGPSRVDQLCKHFKEDLFWRSNLIRYPKNVQREVISRFFDEKGLGYEVFDFWYTIPASRSVILDRLENVTDLLELKHLRIPLVLKIRSKNQPWSRRIQKLTQKLLNMALEDNTYRENDNESQYLFVYYLTGTLKEVYEHNLYFGEI